LGPLFEDQQFTALFPRRGQPAEAPARCALELTDAGFDHTVLSEFRSRLLEGNAALLLLDTLLLRCQEGFIGACRDEWWRWSLPS
jgi:hypothetical protein